MTLGAVFLVVTGAEALYADLGHFGKRPIRAAWLFVALPALTINYLGQGALVLADPKTIENPFFLLYPDWALLPMIALATAATVIASQAVITGAYSITQQAIQLGLLPRLEIRHTSESLIGQIYMPKVNTLLLIGVLLLVGLFRSSSALASAYGIAVTGTMVVTAMMAFVVIWKVWRWSAVAAAAIILPFLLLDLTFLGANLLKVLEGGWMPLALGSVVMLLMYTWRRGSRMLFDKSRKLELPLADLVDSWRTATARVPGTAVFLTPIRQRADCPDAQSQALQGAARKERHSHHRIRRRRGSTRQNGFGRGDLPTFSRILLRFGFMESPNVLKASGSRANWAGNLTSCRPRSSYPAARSGRRTFGHAALAGPPIHRAYPRGNDATNYFQIPTGGWSRWERK